MPSTWTPVYSLNDGEDLYMYGGYGSEMPHPPQKMGKSVVASPFYSEKSYLILSG